MEGLELPGLWSLSPLAALVGVLVLMYWLISTGRLIPKSSHERELSAAQRRGDEWKDAALDARKVIHEQSGQINELVRANRATAKFFNAVSDGGSDERT